MSSRRCSRCGLVNFAEASECKRCGATLHAGDAPDAEATFDSSDKRPRRSFLKRLSWVAGMTLVILFVCYLSLLLTSDAVSWEQRRTIERSIDILEGRGFSREAFVLRRLVSFRSTDNWWNMQVGHRDAYAATNFPFEVVTLYPDFFNLAADDTERAAILLHEAYHLFGSGERAALEGVWRNKQSLGWTEERYGQTRVWKNTRELTENHAPELFRCGDDGKSDCLQ
ncbi:MAG TPA: zinc finger Ran-binding domain-containing protein [Pyrinomonadaceae bacterium]|jgi:hypothetical protein